MNTQNDSPIQSLTAAVQETQAREAAQNAAVEEVRRDIWEMPFGNVYLSLQAEAGCTTYPDVVAKIAKHLRRLLKAHTYLSRLTLEKQKREAGTVLTSLLPSDAAAESAKDSICATRKR